MADIVQRLVLDTSQFQADLQRAQAWMQQAAQGMARQTKTAAGGLRATTKQAGNLSQAVDFLKKRVIGAGLFFAAFYQGLILFRQTVGEVIAEFFNLDDALRRVQSITKQSDESIAELKGELIDLAKQGALFDQTAADVADSMFNIVQAGYESQDALEIARLSAEAAAVGFTTAETASKVLVGVLKAYDMPVSRARDVLDILFQTVDTGIITFEDLANNLGRVTASASALEVPLEEIAGAAATLTLRGFTAAQAMTSVNRILQTFIRPSQRASAAAKELGIELTADTIASKGLVPILNEMWFASGKNANKFAEMFDRIQSTRGALSLMSDDGALLAQVMSDMGLATEGAGALAAAMEHRAKSLKFQLGILRSEILANVTGALQPLTGVLAAVIQEMNKILRGQNALFSFFGDLRGLVLGLVAALLYIKRVAISNYFVGMYMSMRGLTDTVRLLWMEFGVLRGTLIGLGTVVARFAPLLIALGTVALFSVAKKFDPVAASSKRTEAALSSFREEVSDLQDQLSEGLISESQLQEGRAKAALDALSVATKELAGSFEDLNSWTSGWGFKLGMLGGQFRRTLTLDWRSAAQVLRDSFREAVDAILADMEEAGASSEEIEKVVDQLRWLAVTVEDADVAKAFEEAAEKAYGLQTQTLLAEHATKGLKAAANELAEPFADTEAYAGDVKDAITEWLKPLDDARALMEEILGLTSDQEILLRADIEPIEDRIVDRNVEIEQLKRRQYDRAQELLATVDDLRDAEDTLTLQLDRQIEYLEGQNDSDQNRIDLLELQIEREGEIDETLLAQWDKVRLLADKMGALIGLSQEQQRQLALIVDGPLADGKAGIEAWIAAEQAAGRTLDEDVVAALLQVAELTDQQLFIDVSNALANIQTVKNQLATIPSMLPATVTGPTTYAGELPETVAPAAQSASLKTLTTVTQVMSTIRNMNQLMRESEDQSSGYFGSQASGASEAADELGEEEQALKALGDAFRAEGLPADEYQRRIATLVEAMERFDLSADELLYAMQRSGMGAEDFARSLEQLTELDKMRERAEEAREAVDGLYDAMSQLFAKPTKEEAALQLRLAELELQEAEIQREIGPGVRELEVEIQRLRDEREAIQKEYEERMRPYERRESESARRRLEDLQREEEDRLAQIDAEIDSLESEIEGRTGATSAIDDEIQSIREELDVRRARQDVMTAELDTANQLLATDQQQLTTAGWLVQTMGSASANAASLSYGLLGVNVALEGWKTKLGEWMSQLSVLTQVGEITSLQSGIRNFAGGLALINDAGPELVRLPRGTDVIPASAVARTLRGYDAATHGETKLSLESLALAIERLQSTLAGAGGGRSGDAFSLTNYGTLRLEAKDAKTATDIMRDLDQLVRAQGRTRWR